MSEFNGGSEVSTPEVNETPAAETGGEASEATQESAREQANETGGFENDETEKTMDDEDSEEEESENEDENDIQSVGFEETENPDNAEGEQDDPGVENNPEDIKDEDRVGFEGDEDTIDDIDKEDDKEDPTEEKVDPTEEKSENEDPDEEPEIEDEDKQENNDKKSENEDPDEEPEVEEETEDLEEDDYLDEDDEDPGVKEEYPEDEESKDETKETEEDSDKDADKDTEKDGEREDPIEDEKLKDDPNEKPEDTDKKEENIEQDEDLDDDESKVFSSVIDAEEAHYNEESIKSDRYLESKQEKENDPGELEKYDQTDTNIGDVDSHNADPKKDTAKAFEYADANYDKQSAHWQEVANRHLENLTDEKQELDTQVSDVKQKLDDKYREITDYVNENGLSKESSENDPKFQSLSNEYTELRQSYDTLSFKQHQCDNQIKEIEPHIEDDMKTTYKGMNDSDFNDSYNGYITERQGRAVPGYGGVCGINETCSITNQQTGSNFTEYDGVNEYKDNGWCTTDSDYGRNGGTDANDRRAFLESKGLTFDREVGPKLSLDEIAERFNNGESAGLMLKAEDLSQPDLASRKIDFNKSWDENMSRKNANHATTIAGFSYDNAGKVTGVWINDTGGFAGSNRVFIDTEKFDKMQKNTRHFAVEFSKVRE